MKKFLYITYCIVTIILLTACSSEDTTDSFDNTINITKSMDLSRAQLHSEQDEIIPLDGSDSISIRKRNNQLKSINSSTSIYEELAQLNQIPIYLQIKGNTSSKQFLNVNGEGKEATFENYNNNIAQQFYIKILPSYYGIPYMIYSQKTNTPISLGAYKSNPDVKVVYAKTSTDNSTFGASWNIFRGAYSAESFVIENQDYPRQGDSGLWYDIYYSVITANDAKVSLEKYSQLPRQEFSIIPVEEFMVESVTFDTSISTLSNTPYVVFSDKFTNNGHIDQGHTFSINESYKETSSFNRRTSYNVNITTKIKVKVPLIADEEISTSVSEGQEFTYGESEEHTLSIDRTYPIVVPANYIAQMTLILSKYTMNVEYCAVCVGKVSGKRINIRGTWEGVDVQESNAVLNLTPINGQKDGNKSILITKEMISNKNGYIKVE